MEIRPQAWPNSRMIELADERLGRNGRLTAAVGRIYARRLIKRPDLAEMMLKLERARELELGRRSQSVDLTKVAAAFAPRRRRFRSTSGTAGQKLRPPTASEFAQGAARALLRAGSRGCTPVRSSRRWSATYRRITIRCRRRPLCVLERRLLALEQRSPDGMILGVVALPMLIDDAVFSSLGGEDGVVGHRFPSRFPVRRRRDSARPGGFDPPRCSRTGRENCLRRTPRRPCAR